MTPLQLVCVAVVLTGATVAAAVSYSPCEEYPQNVCTVEQVRIKFCEDATPCKLKKGHAASISFNFTPNFSTSKLKSALFWTSNIADLMILNTYESDACQLVSCPTENGKSQEISYSLYLSKKLPARTYTLKWKLWNADNDNQGCCFTTEFKLIK